MIKKIYIFVLGVFVAIVFIFAGIMLNNGKTTNNLLIYPTQTPLKQSSYSIEDHSYAPKTAGMLAKGEIFREVGKTNNQTQVFVIKSPIDGSLRQIFAVDENDITFEKITNKNWSPTDRFLYVYIDYPTRRDIIFIKTDGKFTNGNYYLHSTGLYPNIDVLNAAWIDDQTLELQTKDSNTNILKKYLVSFDDDTGLVTPEY